MILNVLYPLGLIACSKLQKVEVLKKKTLDFA